MLKYILGFIKYLFNPAVSLFAKIDNKSVISRKAKVYGMVQVSDSTMGDYSYIGRKSRLIHADIGKYCSIGSETRVGMGTHTLDKLSTSPIFTEKRNGTGHSWVDTSAVNPFKRVTVGSDVWIGQRAMIMGGITIGNGAVVGAGAIVTKDVPPFAIVAGVPAKVIRFRFSQDTIETINKVKWWELDDKELQKQIGLFQNSFNEDMTERVKLMLGGGILE